MKTILFKLIGRGSDLIDVQPVLALFLGGALIAVFIAAHSNPKSLRLTENPASFGCYTANSISSFGLQAS
jgi:hypothetical protein